MNKLKEEFSTRSELFLDELPNKFINSEVFLKYLIKGTHKKNKFKPGFGKSAT